MDKIIDGQPCIDTKIFKTSISENLDIIPCNVSMADTKLKLQLTIARETVLKRVICSVKKKYNYDYILIDNAPTIEIDFQNSLVASDEVLIVTNPDVFSSDYLALAGVYKFEEALTENRLEKYKEIIIALDNDKPERKASLQIKKLILGIKSISGDMVKVIVPKKENDWNDVLVNKKEEICVGKK